MTRPVLITGGAGFIGSNLADRLARDGHQVLVYDNLSRPGVERNLRWLKARHPDLITPIIADIRDDRSLSDAVSACSAVFHYAAQVAVTTSFDNPIEDFDVNLRGTLGLLDHLRRLKAPVPLIFASTNKVYGNLRRVDLAAEGDAYAPCDPMLREFGIGEEQALDFHTPYGCSKGAADQYVLDWSESFGIPTAVLRMSCIYGPRQFGTEDQGWVAHFMARALAARKITIFGDGRQVRDIHYVADAVETYIRVWRNIGRVAGRAFNLGGGAGNAVSLLRLIRAIQSLLGIELDVEFKDWRGGDQRYYVSDTRRIRSELKLPAPLDWRRGIVELAGWLKSPEAAETARELAAV